MIYLTHDGVNYHIKSEDANDLYSNLAAIRADISAMKAINPGKIKHFKRDSRWNIQEVHGQIDVTIYGKVEEKKKKRKFIKFGEDIYAFVPAICMYDFTGVPWTGYYSAPNRTSGAVFICSGGRWKGLCGTDKDTPFPRTVNSKFNNVYRDNRTLTGADQWGERDWDIYSDYWEKEDSSDDTLFDPMPYLGWDNKNGGKDHVLFKANAISPLSYFGLGPSFCSAESQAFYNEWYNDNWPSPGYAHGSYNLCWNDGFDQGSLASPCGYCPRYTIRDTSILTSYQCGSGHLMSHILAWKMRDYVEYYDCLMGFCFANCAGQYEFESIISEVVGNTQHRTITSTYAEGYYMKSWNGLAISFGQDYGFEESYYTKIDSYMTAPCDTNQTDVYLYNYYYPDTAGWNGAYVDELCDVVGLRGKYFVMYIEKYYTTTKNGSCNPWKCYDYGYSTGVWKEGTCGVCSGTPSINTSHETLCAYVDGAKVVIDVGAENEYFYVNDSHIFNFFGTPVYMYSYSKYLDNGPTYICQYTRYGYFMGSIDSHHQSDKFEPAGITNMYGQISQIHTVPGAENLGNGYAAGQCGGYIVKVEIKEDIEYEL